MSQHHSPNPFQHRRCLRGSSQAAWLNKLCLPLPLSTNFSENGCFSPCLSVSTIAPDTGTQTSLHRGLKDADAHRKQVNICYLPSSLSTSSLAVRARLSQGQGSGWHRQQGWGGGQDTGSSSRSCWRCVSRCLICLCISLSACLKCRSASSQMRSCNDIVVLQSTSGHERGRGSLCSWQGGKIASRVSSGGECVSGAAGARAAFQQVRYDITGAADTSQLHSCRGKCSLCTTTPPPPPHFISHLRTQGARGRGTCWGPWDMAGGCAQWPSSRATGHREHD